MSSGENTTNGQFSNQRWNHNSAAEGNTNNSSPRPPKVITESRVLSLVRERDQQQQQRQNSEPQTKPDYSQPPPSASNFVPPAAYPQPLTLPEIKSQKLSADAKEFVPRAQPVYQSEHYDSSQYNSDDSYGLSVSAEEFVPRGPEEYNSFDQCYQNYSYEVDNTSYYFNQMNLQDSDYSEYSTYDAPSESTGNPILDRFNHSLYVLNMHPGNMEDYLRPVCEMIQRNPQCTDIVNDMVENLFKQSIQEQNFRYTGARICQYLTSNLKSNPSFSGFNKIFMKRCQAEYAKRADFIQGGREDQDRLRGLSMFMAEIFLNVEVETPDGSHQPLQFLPDILMDLIQTLLSKPTEQNVKCSCHMLKLSGSLMDNVVKNNPVQCGKFVSIFDSLKSLQQSPDLPENVKLLIGSVIKLRDGEWNRTSSSPPKKAFQFTSDTNNLQGLEPVFYNHDGSICSRREAGLPDEETEEGAYVLNEEEEEAFLQWQAEQDGLTGEAGPWNYNDTGYESYQLMMLYFSDDVNDDGGMGDEVEAAYEEFLQEQNYIQSYQPPPPPNPHIIPQSQPPIIPHQMHPGFPPLPMNYYGMPPNAQPMHPPMMQPNQLPPNLDQQQQPSQYPYNNSNDPYHYHR
ncbi:polyadenylate-binding protein-interacting protein 1-like [Physella acuta]|uniref:polyadenylate-binding protein-interacting protein 1-like n=1 Tax=Physella acuta TaxID=109671 RepID=UPI0027DE75E7|nr:polyadenylate-binding protein-interacting protein 1-like [Physella acuta]